MVVTGRSANKILVPMKQNSSGMRMKRHRKTTACSASRTITAGCSSCAAQAQGVIRAVTIATDIATPHRPIVELSLPQSNPDHLERKGPYLNISAHVQAGDRNARSHRYCRMAAWAVASSVAHGTKCVEQLPHPLLPASDHAPSLHPDWPPRVRHPQPLMTGQDRRRRRGE